jgi:anti-anti-sigma factor
MSAGELILRHSVRAERHTLVATGELELASTPELVSVVVQILEEGAVLLALDLGDVTFMDSTGLRGILRVRELCEDRGCGLTLGLGQPQVQRVFEVAGLHEMMPIRDSSFGERESYTSRRRRITDGGATPRANA